MKYLPLVWAALWRKPAEAILIWLAVTVSFTLFGLMVGLNATYDRLIENSRMGRLYVNARFANASPVGILLPFALRDQIAQVEGVSAVSSVHYLRGYYRDPHQRATVLAVDEQMRKAWPELPLTGAQWDQLLATPAGVFITRGRAATLGGYAWEFRVAVRDAARANDISVRIDQGLANSSTPTLTIPDKISQIDAVNSGISVASKTWPVPESAWDSRRS